MYIFFYDSKSSAFGEVTLQVLKGKKRKVIIYICIYGQNYIYVYI